MQVKVVLRNLRSTPRKSRQVVDLVRGKKVSDARALLEFTTRKTADPVLKLLNSAIASAVNDMKMEESNLVISEIRVDEGPKLKRSNPESRGRAFPILKRTSHIMLTVSEIKPKTEIKEAKVEKVPVKKEEKASVKKTTKKAK